MNFKSLKGERRIRYSKLIRQFKQDFKMNILTGTLFNFPKRVVLQLSNINNAQYIFPTVTLMPSNSKINKYIKTVNLKCQIITLEKMIDNIAEKIGSGHILPS